MRRPSRTCHILLLMFLGLVTPQIARGTPLTCSHFSRTGSVSEVRFTFCGIDLNQDGQIRDSSSARTGEFVSYALSFSADSHLREVLQTMMQTGDIVSWSSDLVPDRFGFSYDKGSNDVTAVPEPNTFAMLSAGVTTLILVRRRLKLGGQGGGPLVPLFQPRSGDKV